MATCADVEGWGPASILRDFDLTPCFEEGVVLAGLLAGLLFASFLHTWWVLHTQQPRERSARSRRLLWAKLVLLVGAAVASAANFAVSLTGRVPVRPFYALEALALATATGATYAAHTRTRTASPVLLLFWPLYAAGVFVWARTLLAHGGGGATPFVRLLLALRGTALALGLLAFALEWRGPESRADLGPYEDPILVANVYERWVFSYLTPLLARGATEFITEEDLPDMLPKDQAAKLGQDLQAALARTHSLWRSLFIAYGGPYAQAACLKLVQDSLAFLQPQLLRLFLLYIAMYQRSRQDGDDHESSKAWAIGAIAVLMFIAAMTQTVILHQYFQICYETGMRVRGGLVTVIYQKALRLSNDKRGRSTGDIVNLQSTDTTRLQDLCTYGLISISGPFQITLAFISLYRLLGWSAFVGVAIMILSIPLNTYIASILKTMQQEQMKNRDQRTRLMSETLANITSIKLHAWEDAFVRRILQVRNSQELVMLRKIGIASSLNQTLWGGIPLIVAFSSFAVAAAVSPHPLTSDIVFPSISLFMLLQFPLAMFSQVTSNIIEAFVSVKRLSAFLKAEELQVDARRVEIKSNLQVGDEVLSIDKGEFAWSKQALQPTLEDINLRVKKGDLVGIVGRVGAGKTSLLSAIVGDMIRTEGEVTLHGSVAYAPQEPFIMSASVKENILFSHQFDEEYYELVLDACALRPDLQLLGDGDETLVGEKGITLSGGQRARISLARAVYARADLVLLDDVLSALDAQVAAHVFEQVIGPRGLLASKARIVVTHSVSFLRHFDLVLLVRRGIILESGTYESLVATAGGEFSQLIHRHGGTYTSGSTTPYTNGTASPNVDGLRTPSTSSANENEKPLLIDALPSKLNRRDSFGKAVLVQTTSCRSSEARLSVEHREKGRVNPKVYVQYVKAASKAGFVFFIMSSIAQQVLLLLSNLSLRAWGEHNQQAGRNADFRAYLLSYGLFSLGSIFCGAAASVIIWVLCSLRSAKHLHDSMLGAVMRAPLSFFELTPTGRILNVFSRDTYVVDTLLARVISNVVRTLCVCVGIVVVIGAAFPPFLIAVIPLTLFYSRVMKYYLSTSRELKRLDAVSRSPMFAWFAESLNGLSTIRAMGLQAVWTTKNETWLDRNQICYLPGVGVNRWLAVRLEFMGSLIIFLSSLLALLALMTTGVDAGLVGLVLSYALNTTSSLNWAVRSLSELEQNITSVERILHYVDLPPEAPQELPEKPDQEWPYEGAVEFREYSTRYRPELDLVLRNISMAIKPREKVGIVGRTGSGKSTMLLALFRIIEATSGQILIDGVDIKSLGLHELRRAVSIVPQSPDLFEGTLRENVDPTGSYDDAEIWAALDKAHLKEYVNSLAGALDSQVTEGGSSMSSGQRQLLCFARALLRKSKILVLDEATSAVDLETDFAIQQILRDFDVTMLTIAHRLNTILHSDRVLVLDAGKIVEFDTPEALLANKDSSFYSLASEAGLV